MEELIERKQSRSWMLTLPEQEYSQEMVEKALQKYAYIGQLERGSETDYVHWQIYIENASPISFKTLRRKFPKGHFEVRKGTKKGLHDYVTKSETSLGVHISNGVIDLKESSQGSRSDLQQFHTSIVERGMSARDVVLTHPQALRYVPHLERLQLLRDSQTWGVVEREVTVKYWWGKTGCGKTRRVHHEFSNFYRVTDYEHPFDAYNGEEVLVLDEFRSQLDFSFLLNLLDRYPLQLPARYSNRYAAFNTVILISNIPIEEQYPAIRASKTEQWSALMRRIKEIEHFETRAA